MFQVLGILQIGELGVHYYDKVITKLKILSIGSRPAQQFVTTQFEANRVRDGNIWREMEKTEYLQRQDKTINLHKDIYIYKNCLGKKCTN